MAIKHRSFAVEDDEEEDEEEEEDEDDDDELESRGDATSFVFSFLSFFSSFVFCFCNYIHKQTFLFFLI